MAHFEATVRVFDVIESDATTARRALEERLRTSGFTRWQIVSIGLQGAISRPVTVRGRRPIRAQASYAGGGMLVAAVVAWALWFLWLLAN